MKLYRDLVIESTGELTLTCHLVMLPDANIIVKPGGRLILDGATIGVDLFERSQWRGIEVWGNSSAHQYLVGGQYQQGYVELKNGAVIENALCALELWKPGDYSKTGGIVHATDAVFRDNAKAVHMLCYQNHNPVTHGNAGQKVLDLRDLPSGVYVYTVRCGGSVQTGKLVVSK